MKITFHGAARTVTGSQHLIEVNGKTIMLDCGMFQGKRKESFELNRSGFCQGEAIDCLVLSHAHIDHSGRIPCLVKNGFNGDIFCTSATRDLCAVMLMDSAFIQEKDVEFVNRRRQKKGQRLFEPLYTKADVAEAMKQFVGLSYNRRHQLFPGIHLTLVDAGHMLGSAHVILDIDDQGLRPEAAPRVQRRYRQARYPHHSRPRSTHRRRRYPDHGEHLRQPFAPRLSRVGTGTGAHCQ